MCRFLMDWQRGNKILTRVLLMFSKRRRLYQSPIDAFIRPFVRTLVFIMAGALTSFGGSALADARDDAVRAAIVAHASRDYSRAIEIYSSILQDTNLSDLQRVDLLKFRARSYQEANEDRRAVEDLTAAIKLASTNFDLYAQRGFVYLLAGRLIEAKADFEMGLKLDPSNAFIQYGLGRTLAARRDYAEAINRYTRAIALDDGIGTYYLWRAEAHLLSKQYAEALRDYDRAIAIGKLSPADKAQLYLGRGYFYVETDRPDLAITDLDEVLRFNPRNLKALKWRGWAHDKLRNFVKAIGDYEAVLAIEPHNNQIAERVRKLRAALQ